MRALVTGATGFIGSVLVQELLGAGWEVAATARSPDPYRGDIRWHRWELSESPDHGMLDDVDVVFHLAGKAHALSEKRDDNREYDILNYGGTQRLLAAALDRGVRRFIYFSSVKAVADQPGIMDHSIRQEADTPYGRSKRKAELLLLQAADTIEPVILRPTMVYGPTDKGNLPRMIRAVRCGIFPPLSAGDNRRSMIHVRDVARAAVLLATHDQAPGGIFIASDGEAYAIDQIHRWICAALRRPYPRWQLPMAPLRLAAAIGDAIGNISGRRFPLDSDTLHKLLGDARYDSSPLRALGFLPQTTLQEAMPEIVHFACTAGHTTP